MEIRIDGRPDDDPLDSLYRWLAEDSDLGASGARVRRGSAAATRGMGASDWLQITADALAVGQIVVHSVNAWRRSRRPLEPEPPIVRFRCRGMEFEVGDDSEDARKAFDDVDPGEQ